jgi:hypothetical protein
VGANHKGVAEMSIATEAAYSERDLGVELQSCATVF